MAVESQGIAWITESNAAEVFRRDVEAAKRLQVAYEKLTKNVDTSTASGKRAAAELRKRLQASADLGKKLEAETRIRQRAAEMVRKHGIAMGVAMKVSRDLERAGRSLTAETLRQAQAYDRAEREIRQLTAEQRKATGATGGLARAMRNAAVQILAIGGGIEAMRRGVGVLTEFEDAAIGVEKTTGLTSGAVDRLLDGFGELSTGPLRVAISTYQELAVAAGQVGIATTSGLEAAVTTGAKLQLATDLAGDAAITSLSKILQVQDEQIEQIEVLGAVITGLGNVTTRSESHIARVANEVARGTANFKIGSTAAAGLAAAYIDMGVQAEVAGSSTATLLNAVQLAASTGKKLEDFARVAGLSADEFKRLVDEDVLEASIVLLDGIGRTGRDGAAVLKDLGIGSLRTAKSLLPLAANTDNLRQKLALANEEARTGRALDIEVEKANKTLSASFTALVNAVKLLVDSLSGSANPALKGIVNGLVQVLLGLQDVGRVLAFFTNDWRILSAVLLGVAVKTLPALIASIQALHARLLLLGASVPILTAIGLALFALGKAAGAMSGVYAREIDTATEATRRHADAQDRLAEAIGSGSRAMVQAQITAFAVEQAAAAQKLSQAWFDITAAAEGLAQAERDLAAAEESAGRSVPLRQHRPYVEAKAAVDQYAAALEAAQQQQGEATASDRAASAALGELLKALGEIEDSEAHDRQRVSADKLAKALKSLTETLETQAQAARLNAKNAAALAAVQEQGPRAVARLSKEMEIQRTILLARVEAEKAGVASSVRFRAALEDLESALREEAAAEERLAGAQTTERLREAVAAEAALATQTRATVIELEAQAEIARAVADASGDQAAAIERLIRLQRAQRAAREQASNLRELADEVNILRRQRVAREEGAEAVRRLAEQLELEAVLRQKIVTGLPVELALLISLTRQRQLERAAAASGEAQRALDQELEDLELRNRVLAEAIEKGLSYAEAMREVAIAVRSAQILRDHPGLDPEEVRAQVAAIHDASAAYEKASERMRDNASEVASEVGRLFATLSEFFDQTGSEFGRWVAQLMRLVSVFTDLAKSLQAANAAAGSASASTGSSSGAALAALGTVGAVLGAFVAVYQIADQLIKDRKARRFALPVSGGIESGRFRGQALLGDSAAISQQTGMEAVAAIRSSIEQFELVLGQSLDFFPDLGVEVRNDGEQFRLTIGGVFHGIFEDFATAMSVGMRIAMGQVADQLSGENLSRAAQRVGASTAEEFLALIPVLIELDDVAAGLTRGLSRALLARRQELTALDHLSETLLAHGVALEDIIALRDREIQAMLEQTQAAGLQLAGISDLTRGLGPYLDMVEATIQALEEEEERRAELARQAEARAEAEARRGGGGPGGGPENPDRSKGDEGGIFTFAVAAEEASVAGFRAAEATAEYTRWLSEVVREIVSITAQTTVLGEILAFQERYGVIAVDNEVLRSRIHELEFRASQLRIQVLVLELAANRELLGLTRAQVNQYLQWADAIASADAPEPVRIAGGGRRRQAGEDRARALERWADQVERLTRLSQGATESELALEAAREAVRDAAAEAGASAEDLAVALTALAQIQLAEVVEDWAEIIRQATETDIQTELRGLAERAVASFAEALAAAGDDESLYAGAAATIGEGAGILFQETVQDEIDRLVAAGDTEGLAQLFDEIGHFLGGEFPPEMQGVIDGFRRWLAEAERSASAAMALAAAEARLAEQREAGASAIERWREQERLQAEAREEFREELEDMVDDGLSPALASVRRINREYQAQRQRVDELSLSEQERAAALTIIEADRRRAMNDAAFSLLNEIEALARAAGVELPVEMARQWAQIQFDLARAQILVALASGDMRDALVSLGVDIGAIVDFVVGLDLAPPAGGGRGGRGREMVRVRVGNKWFLVPKDAVEGEADEAEGDTLADIVQGLLRDAMTPDERLLDDWQRLKDAIAAAAGTEQERIEALRLAEEAYHRDRLAGLRSLREELLDEEALGTGSPRKAFESAQDAFEVAVASGDASAIEAAARTYLRAAEQFGEGFSRRAAEAQARRDILAGLGPLVGGTPAPAAAAASFVPGIGFGLGAGPGPPPLPAGGLFSPPQAQPSFGALEQQLALIDQRLARLEVPLGVISANTGATARNTHDLPLVASKLRRQ